VGNAITTGSDMCDWRAAALDIGHPTGQPPAGGITAAGSWLSTLEDGGRHMTAGKRAAAATSPVTRQIPIRHLSTGADADPSRTAVLFEVLAIRAGRRGAAALVLREATRRGWYGHVAPVAVGLGGAGVAAGCDLRG